MTTIGFGVTAVERCGAVALQVLRRIGQPPWYFNGHCGEGAACIGGAQQICATINASPATTLHVRPDID